QWPPREMPLPPALGLGIDPRAHACLEELAGLRHELPLAAAGELRECALPPAVEVQPVELVAQVRGEVARDRPGIDLAALVQLLQVEPPGVPGEDGLVDVEQRGDAAHVPDPTFAFGSLRPPPGHRA